MDTARKAFVTTLVAVAVILLALALWKLRLVLALLFVGFIIAAAIAPVSRRCTAAGSRGPGVTLHYAVFVGLIALCFWFVVPRALHQVTAAVDDLPERGADRRRGEAVVGDQAGVLLSCSSG